MPLAPEQHDGPTDEELCVEAHKAGELAKAFAGLNGRATTDADVDRASDCALELGVDVTTSLDAGEPMFYDSMMRGLRGEPFAFPVPRS